MKVKSLSCVQLFAIQWTIAHHAPLSMGFSGQEYWNGLPFPSPEDLPNPGLNPCLPHCKQDALPSEPPGKLGGKRGLKSKGQYCVQNDATEWSSESTAMELTGF